MGLFSLIKNEAHKVMNEAYHKRIFKDTYKEHPLHDLFTGVASVGEHILHGAEDFGKSAWHGIEGVVEGKESIGKALDGVVDTAGHDLGQDIVGVAGAVGGKGLKELAQYGVGKAGEILKPLVHGAISDVLGPETKLADATYMAFANTIRSAEQGKGQHVGKYLGKIQEQMPEGGIVDGGLGNLNFYIDRIIKGKRLLYSFNSKTLEVKIHYGPFLATISDLRSSHPEVTLWVDTPYGQIAYNSNEAVVNMHDVLTKLTPQAIPSVNDNIVRRNLQDWSLKHINHSGQYPPEIVHVGWTDHPYDERGYLMSHLPPVRHTVDATNEENLVHETPGGGRRLSSIDLRAQDQDKRQSIVEASGGVHDYGRSAIDLLQGKKVQRTNDATHPAGKRRDYDSKKMKKMKKMPKHHERSALEILDEKRAHKEGETTRLSKAELRRLGHGPLGKESI